ncbi:DUF2914 domain-containing protein [Hanstruepera ponticola]|uniref:DUF2914 domain-containing protein n=1 Tax=Hanstruepera ponticola TaxID=2042995 RepID=UPI001781D42C|nr:DUF2914 domain-containing protein [Hanstruepera ponticola]
MKRTLVKFRNSRFRQFLKRHEKYAPIIFFIGGFIFDSLTLGRIDRLYDLIVLSSHMTLLSIMLYIYNLADDNKWENTFLERYQIYFPLAIQFFFGGLSSAFVIYFSRSVSLSKTAIFFILLVILLLTNELLKKRISNKYLQFGIYSFISFTFFSFMVPVFYKEVSKEVFIISGLISLIVTVILITIIYKSSPSTRAEINLKKVMSLVFGIYFTLNLFYFFKLIPPVPLALNEGIVAHNIKIENGNYYITYEADDWFIFWRDHKLEYIHDNGSKVYIFSSLFAPTDLKESVFHRWKWFDPETNSWNKVEDIGFEIFGGRDDGFRGYTFKQNVKEGLWKVEVITDEELVIGVIDFEIITDSNLKPKRLKTRKY